MKCRVFAPLLLAGALLTTAACVHPTLTPVANVANIVGQVEDTADVIVKAAKTAHDTVVPATGEPLLTATQLTAVAIAVDHIGREGQDVKRGLDAYNAAKAAGSNVTAQAAAVNQALAAVVQGLADIGNAVPAGTVQQIDRGVASILQVVIQIQAGLAQ